MGRHACAGRKEQHADLCGARTVAAMCDHRAKHPHLKLCKAFAVASDHKDSWQRIHEDLEAV